MGNNERELDELNPQNEEKRKINVKIETDENGLEKDIEIQDPSLNVNNGEERPGVGIEIFGITTPH